MANPFRRLFWSPLTIGEWPLTSSPSYAIGAMDWTETPNSHILKFNVPGFGKDDIKVNLEENNVLVIQGEPVDDEEQQKEKEKDKDVIWYIAERGKGGFSRQIQLPETVKTDQIKASVDKGVLTVVVPKEMPKAKPKPKAIHVASKL